MQDASTPATPAGLHSSHVSFFPVPYRPGSQDLKADALARLHAPYQPSEPEPILPPALILSPIQWELTKNIHDTTRTEPSP